MTTISIDLRGGDGTTPAIGSLTFTPTRRATISGTEAYVILPSPVEVVLDAGKAEINLRPTDGSWAWVATEHTSKGTRRIIAVPDSTIAVRYGELVDVLLATVQPLATVPTSVTTLLNETTTILEAITSSTITTTVSHAWLGTAHASPSVRNIDGVVAQKNLATNPSMGTGIDGWVPGSWGNGGDGTHGRIATGGTPLAPAFVRMTVRVGATNAYMSYVDGLGTVVTPGEAYTVSYWVRYSKEGRIRISVAGHALDGSGWLDMAGNNTIVQANVWTRLSITLPSIPAAVQRVRVLAEILDTTATGDLFDVTGLLIEQGYRLTQYFDGSSPTKEIVEAVTRSTSRLLDGAYLLNGWVFDTVKALRLSREGTQVTLSIAGLSLSGTSATADQFLTLPQGFRPDLPGDYGTLGLLNAGGVPTFASKDFSAVAIASRAASVSGILTWRTDDAWPTTLPGTLA